MTGDSATPIRFSFIIPAYNEAGYLPRLLDTLDAARKNYAGGSAAIEVIVADNCSTDATANLAEERGCRVVRVEKRVIAAARNGGASVARGEILCFCDADMQVHPETFGVIDRALATGRVVAGATGVKLERISLGLAVTYALMVSMVWVMKMDTGVVFCRREDFETIGGYNEERLFAEDVQFLVEMRRHGRTRRQGLTRATAAKAITSTRKFDKHGDWHYFRLFFFEMPGLISSRFSAGKFARKYWYDDPR